MKRHLLTIFGAWILLVTAGSTWGQGPHHESGFRWFSLDRVKGYLELESKYTKEVKERDGLEGNWWNSKELEFYETLSLDLTGAIYHQRFLVWEAGTTLSLVQRRLKAIGYDKNSDRLLSSYRGQLTFLREHPYTLTLFGRRDDREMDRLYATTIHRQQETLGVRLHHHNGVLPWQLLYSRTRTEEAENGNAYRQVNDRAQGSVGYDLGGWFTGDLSYSWERLDQRSTDLVLQRHQLQLQNRTDFMPERNHLRLTTQARFMRRSNHIDADVWSWNEGLHWRISDSLQSNTGASFSYTDNTGDIVRIVAANQSLIHQLYQSLITQPQVQGSWSRGELEDSTTLRAQWHETYRKRMGKAGNFSLQLTPGWQRIQRRPAGDEGRVTGEVVTFTDDLPRALAQPRVIEGSVTVSDPQTLRVYEEGVDYRLDDVPGQRTEITRLITGEIPEEGTVLVDYRYGLGQDFTLEQLDFSGELRFNLHCCGEYYVRYTCRNQDQVDGDNPLIIDDLREWLLGARWDRKFVLALVEYQDRNADIDPFWAIREMVSLRLQPARWFGFHLSGRHQDLYRDAYSDVFRTVQTNVGLRWIITNGMVAELEGEYRLERWDETRLNQDLDAWVAKASWQWYTRQLVFEVWGRYTVLEYSTRRDERATAFASIRREF